MQESIQYFVYLVGAADNEINFGNSGSFILGF